MPPKLVASTSKLDAFKKPLRAGPLHQIEADYRPKIAHLRRANACAGCEFSPG